MPVESWTRCKVLDVKANVRNAIVGGPFGSSLVSKDYRENGVPVIRGINLSGKLFGFNSSEFVFVSEEKANELTGNLAFPGDVVFTQRGTLGQVAVVPDNLPYRKFLISQSQMKLTCDYSKALPLYIYYYFKSPEILQYIRQHTISTGVPHINLGILKEAPLLLPPIDKQEKIVDVLRSFDDKIECNRRINHTLEQMAQALYKHWFVDFAPFRDGEFVETELGLIPTGWEAKPIGDVVETLGGSTPSTAVEEYWVNGDINWYSPTDITKAGSLFVSESAKKITAKGLAESSARLFPPHSVMMTSRATIGAISINCTEACTNQGFITLVPNEQVSACQLVFWLRQNMPLIMSKANGSTFKEISRSNFRPLLIPVAEDATEFNRQAGNMFTQIEMNISESAILARTRDYLLPKLLSGAIEVKAAEEQVEALV